MAKATGRFGDAVAFVTGAGHGIGRATALRLGSEGAGVVCLDLNGETAQQAAAAVDASGGGGLAAQGDVRDRACLIIDDMISTGGTISESIQALLEAGARPAITVAATHGLFINGAREKLSHESIQGIFVTDSAPVENRSWSQLHVVSIAPVIASAIRKIMTDGSLSSLF